MFDGLGERLNRTFRKLRGVGKLTPSNIEKAVNDVKLNLLESDVNYHVVMDFVSRVKEKALGTEVIESVTPYQKFVKIVYDELVYFLGDSAPQLNIKRKPPVVILLFGLQGSGKTTTAAKLAKLLKEDYKRLTYLVPADIYRPAAIDQLNRLAEQAGVSVHPVKPDQLPEQICKEALEEASTWGYDTLIVDTAGRLQIDEELMQELEILQAVTDPAEKLLVVDAMTGQNAVNVAREFHGRLGITGVILTKTDGDARGGAALSIKSVVGAPIKFCTTGEKLDQIEVFRADRIASRILNMGDIVTLVEKAQKVVDTDRARKMQKRVFSKDYSLEDFREQIKMIKKMGSLQELMKLIPGMSLKMKQLEKLAPPDEELKKIEAIINSMTPLERRKIEILNASRKRRIAKGSGTTVQDVNNLIRQFKEMKKMLKRFKSLGGSGLMSILRGL